MPPRTNWSAVPSPLEPAHQPEGDISRATLAHTSGSSSDPHTSSSGAAPSSRALPLSPVPASPTAPSPRGTHPPRHHRSNSENYYEDIDPRFTEEPLPQAPGGFHAMSHESPHNHSPNRESGIPNALTPGPQYTGRKPPLFHVAMLSAT